MALTPEEKAQLDALTQKANAPEESEDDFEIEIYSPSGSGARVPYAKGRAYLQREFGIDLDPDPASAGGSEGSQDDKGSKPAGDGKGSSGAKAPKQQAAKDAGDAAPSGYWSRRKA